MKMGLNPCWQKTKNTTLTKKCHQLKNHKPRFSPKKKVSKYVNGKRRIVIEFFIYMPTSNLNIHISNLFIPVCGFLHRKMWLKCCKMVWKLRLSNSENQQKRVSIQLYSNRLKEINQNAAAYSISPFCRWSKPNSQKLTPSTNLQKSKTSKIKP